MTTRIISLRDVDDDDPLPPPTPLPVHGPPLAAPVPAEGGVLVFQDGSVVVVAHTTVVGRDPVADPRVVAGQMHGAVLAGADLVVSRRHAELRLSSGGVDLVDLGSTNGTMVKRAHDDAWTRLDPQVTTPLQHGDQVSFGGLTCRFEPLRDRPSS